MGAVQTPAPVVSGGVPSENPEPDSRSRRGARRAAVVAVAVVVVLAVVAVGLIRSTGSTPPPSGEPVGGGVGVRVWSGDAKAAEILSRSGLSPQDRLLAEYWAWIGPHCAARVGAGEPVTTLCQVDLTSDEWAWVAGLAPDPEVVDVVFPRWWEGSDAERVLAVSSGRVGVRDQEVLVWLECRSVLEADPAGVCVDVFGVLPDAVVADLRADADAERG